MVVNRPVYGYTDSIGTAKKRVEHNFNLNTGEEINQERKIAFHGLERNN